MEGVYIIIHLFVRTTFALAGKDAGLGFSVFVLGSLAVFGSRKIGKVVFFLNQNSAGSHRALRGKTTRHG